MEQMRSEFEEWFKPRKEAMQIRGIATHRIVKLHQRMWESWQASRAVIELDLPKKYYSEAYLGNGCCDDYANDKLDEVYQVVRAAGLRVKESK